MEVSMAKQIAYPFLALSLAFCSFNSFSAENSTDYNVYSKQVSTNLDSNLTYNCIQSSDCQDNSDSKIKENSDTEMEEIFGNNNDFSKNIDDERYYKITYDPSVYSDGYDSTYMPAKKLSLNKWEKLEQEHTSDWIKNLRALKLSTVNPTPKDLHNCFLNTRHIKILYRKKYMNKKTGNTYYLRKGITPTKTPHRQDNLKHIRNRKRPVWVNQSTGQVTSYCIHHLSQSNLNELLVMMPQEIHWEYSKLFHQRNDSTTVVRNDFAKENPQIFKTVYMNENKIKKNKQSEIKKKIVFK